MVMMHRNKSVDVHQFSMVPRNDIPRSTFRMQTAHKTTFDSGYLVPVYHEEVLPGDSFALRMMAFARLSTPIFPVMDNLYLDSFFFFVPYRLLWSNWRKFMGEQANPGDSISFSIPQMVSPASGYVANSLQDYFGLPTVGQVTGGATVSHSSLPLRAYNLVYNEWFRDENLQNSVTVDTGDGPDTYSNYVLKRRGKRKDYFSGALPWPQKGNTPVSLPLGTSAVIVNTVAGGANNAVKIRRPSDGALLTSQTGLSTDGSGLLTSAPGAANAFIDPNGSLIADLTNATAATVNQLRQSIAIQQFLERDARGGTRYTEYIRTHFGVASPDARLQRPEYLGGASVPIVITPIAQASATGLTGGSTPVGTLSAIGTAVHGTSGFTQSFTEHGIVLGIVSVRADLSYQQGLRRFWSRKTRYDFYDPVFANLGEQSILNKEIYAVGSATGGITAGDQDMNVFAYTERWNEYRHNPSLITGLFRSTNAAPLDGWHLSQKFTGLPTLGDTFISETPPVSRVIAVSSVGKEFIFDSFFDVRATRPMPMFSVPGLTHF